MDYDVFNGDADGLCALHQWRLAHPAPAARRVTGVKRDIKLLEGLPAQAGDQLTVFDISFDSNRPEALRLLDAGVSIRWFDHHFAGELPAHPGFVSHIDTAADVCSSLLVDRELGGRFHLWAMAGAYGDNLRAEADRLAAAHGLPENRRNALAELGELLNYNGYGDTVADLHLPPADLYAAMAGFADPFDFIERSPAVATLRAGLAADLAAAGAVRPLLDQGGAAAYRLPDAAWARRVVGVLANRLALAAPDKAHALLVPDSNGTLTISVRAPKARPQGADTLCLGFPNGGGRKAAAGINRLPEAALADFLRAFAEAYP